MAIARPESSLMLCKSVSNAATVLSGDTPTKIAASAPFLLQTYCMQRQTFSKVPQQAACHSTRQCCTLLELGNSEQFAMKEALQHLDQGAAP